MPWHEQMLAAKRSLETRLHITHPILRSLMHLWDLELKVCGFCSSSIRPSLSTQTSPHPNLSPPSPTPFGLPCRISAVSNRRPFARNVLAPAARPYRISCTLLKPIATKRARYVRRRT
jgi:hypothetical protein